MQLNRRFTKLGRVHRFLVEQDAAGWEVREEEDTAVLRRAHRRDWHRVERDALLFEIRAHELAREGWIEDASPL